MTVEIRGIGVEVPDALRSHVRERLGFALGRFGKRVRHATVRFSSDSAELVCRVTVDTSLARRLVVEDRDSDPYAAAGRTIGRLGRSMARTLERLRIAG